MKNLEPTALWSYFYQITQIPRPSKKEIRIRTFLKNFANEQQLICMEDVAGNLIIRKKAAVGYENSPTVILQAHMDMVCEKNSEVEHNFETDAIKTYIEDDWIKAKGTTLGADNGIGIAIIMAVLADKHLPHPTLECLFTVDEETGLTGALMLEKNFLTGSVLINLDSEDDGEVFIGCAGGIGTKAIFNYQTEMTPDGMFGCKVKVSGLTGGHSGGDIHLGLGNAIKILNRYLWHLNRQMDVRLVSFDGGNLHNAIPREASAFLAVPYAEKETIRVLLNHFIIEMEEIFSHTDPQMKITLASEPLPGLLIEKTFSNRLLNALYACPHGVIAMSKDIPGLVETSTNLASIKTKANQQIEINTSQRSSVESAKSDIASQVYSVFDLAGAQLTQSEGYPGWKPNINSNILNQATSAYQRLFHEEVKVKAIHAGLECGLFLEKYPHLDMISIGPQMYGVHSPDERLSINSTQKTWNWLLEILKYC
jgi:dipeptidase D